jgi:hypothetical protein
MGFCKVHASVGAGTRKISNPPPTGYMKVESGRCEFLKKPAPASYLLFWKSQEYVLVPNPTSKVGRGYLSQTQVPFLEYTWQWYSLGLRLE